MKDKNGYAWMEYIGDSIPDELTTGNVYFAWVADGDTYMVVSDSDDVRRYPPEWFEPLQEDICRLDGSNMAGVRYSSS